ncbi:MAG: ATP-binding protein [Pseudomonadota bacterium]
MRIRSRLLLLVLAVLIPAVLGAAIAAAYIYDEEQQFHHTSMREAARAMALALDREMARREAVLRTLTASFSLRAGDLERFHDVARRVAQDSGYTIILSDLQGRQLLHTGKPYGAPLGTMLPMEREFRARFGNEPTLISDVYGPPTGQGPYYFAVELPVRRDGQVAQFLTLSSSTAQLQALLTQQHLPARWHATIVDSAGVLAARSEDADKFVGKPVRPELLRKIRANEEGFHEGSTLASVAATAFFSRAPRSHWTFLVSVPDSMLHGPARRAIALLSAITLLLLGLGLVTAIMVARRIARPIESLREAAERLGRNEPVAAQASGTLELDAVQEALVQASERLRGSQAELERRVRDALAGYEESQRALLQAQKLEALGRLTGGIAHDFNNVLQTLTSGLQTLKRQAPEAQQALLGRCQRAVARGTELARQLMAFGRVQEVRRETLDTTARLSDMRALLNGALPTHTQLDYDLVPGLWPVAVDPAQLELALLNLVINARDAMPAGGSVVLRGSNETVAAPRPDLAAGDYVVLTLSDTGEGMKPEVMAHALDPFYTTKEVGRGSGMGLPQAYGFARQNGGTLALESEPGQGTTVRLYLPRARQPLPLRPAAHTLPGLPPCKGRVLLVEDDELVRETVSTALAAAGFDIETASSADEALHRLDGGERFDAVLTDVVMPGVLSGLDLAQHVLQRHPGTGVVVASGYSEHSTQLAGVHALPKPYDLQQAVDALNAAVAG